MTTFVKVLFMLLIIAGTHTHVKAQVTIGSGESPHNDALLDLKENSGGTATKGLLLPRVALQSINLAAPLSGHVKGMTVYNTGTSLPSVEPKYYLSPGFYYNDGTQWVRLNYSYTNWFYMPSVSFDTSSDATGQTKDLYSLYKSQFDGTSPTFAKSAGAPSAVPYIPAADELFYYVTSYDANVFSNISITANGVMTYDVAATATDCSYINIVFVLK
ncbi:MAG: hypothetical protein LBQ74_00445 [Prevotella sp.]|nr:hypothetical protein [Prevotella sp.]